MPERARVILSRRECDGAFFDMDGVLTDSARLHAAAWKRLFDDLLRRRAAATGAFFVPFGKADYLAHVDGRPRKDGVRCFLASRGIHLPEGSASDPEEADTIAALARRKDRLFGLELRAGVDPAPGAEALLRKLRRLGIRTAVASSSRNCAAVLEAAGLAGLLDARVDGLDVAALGLEGKPAPDLFLEAARRLGVAPGRAVLFEDALAGVAAGRRGGFGQVVGVDRGGQATELLRHGADVVIRDLSQVEVAPC
ncbi:MAG: HAD-IA family hydrolase [Acetobacteraceae bacterium]|nr:HAD-IA family hydrolase [Acetobacteraceae bacterium]